MNIIRDYSLRGDIAAETGEDPAAITEVGAVVMAWMKKIASVAGFLGKRQVTNNPTLTHPNQDRIGAAVIMCKDLENYSEQDWSVLLDKPELVFARARSVRLHVHVIVNIWCLNKIAPCLASSLLISSIPPHVINKYRSLTARRTSWSSAGTSAPATRWVHA